MASSLTIDTTIGPAKSDVITNQYAWQFAGEKISYDSIAKAGRNPLCRGADKLFC